MADISARKADHIDITTQRVVTPQVSPGWDDIHLIHQSLPEIDLQDVKLGVRLFGSDLRAPLVIASMTGGHPRAGEINRRLAQAAQEFGIAMGVGSQRAAIRNPDLMPTYSVAREHGPDVFLIANVGAPQLIDQDTEPALSVGDVKALVDAMGADALAIHLNYLQEVVQPEGDQRARGCLDAIRLVAASLNVPIIAKETGAGINRAQAQKLKDAGIRALDVGGAGGTSFALVESFRAADRHLGEAERLGQAFGGWGLPTAVSVVECLGLGVPVIATGGIRGGLDAAKALALGADLVGVARPMLSVAMFLVGATTIADLNMCERVVLGRTGEWLAQRGGSERPGLGRGRGPSPGVRILEQDPR
ncbi:MAG: type 2 isopentenyl-diphosphate Delta-isomerase [Chloroflexi bacterium]|nr:type 2 isopentenyl-diphosphate Delta-isomerase [Chloroflexota bacterium]